MHVHAGPIPNSASHFFRTLAAVALTVVCSVIPVSASAAAAAAGKKVKAKPSVAYVHTSHLREREEAAPGDAQLGRNFPHSLCPDVCFAVKEVWTCCGGMRGKVSSRRRQTCSQANGIIHGSQAFPSRCVAALQPSAPGTLSASAATLLSTGRSRRSVFKARDASKEDWIRP